MQQVNPGNFSGGAFESGTTHNTDYGRKFGERAITFAPTSQVDVSLCHCGKLKIGGSDEHQRPVRRFHNAPVRLRPEGRREGNRLSSSGWAEHRSCSLSFRSEVYDLSRSRKSPKGGAFESGTTHRRDFVGPEGERPAAFRPLDNTRTDGAFDEMTVHRRDYGAKEAER